MAVLIYNYRFTRGKMKSRATQTKELDMVNGPLARKILIYSIPLMFSNLLQVFLI